MEVEERSNSLVLIIPSTDYDHEPIHKRARALLRDPRIGPVLYWDLQNQNHCPDGDKYQATAWRTIPDYQGGACRPVVVLGQELTVPLTQASYWTEAYTRPHFFG